MKSLSLKAQILLLVIGVVTTAVVSLIYLTYQQIQAPLHQSLELKAISISSVIAENIAPGLDF